MIKTKEDGSWIRITVSMETSRDRCVHSINSTELCDWIDVGMWGRKESENNLPQQTKFPLGSLTAEGLTPIPLQIQILLILWEQTHNLSIQHAFLNCSNSQWCPFFELPKDL